MAGSQIKNIATVNVALAAIMHLARCNAPNLRRLIVPNGTNCFAEQRMSMHTHLVLHVNVCL
jgi:hypothetical protein